MFMYMMYLYIIGLLIPIFYLLTLCLYILYKDGGTAERVRGNAS